MSAIVSFCFDVVGWLSALLNGLFLPVARGDADLAAMMVCALCLIVVCLCHDFFSDDGRERTCVKKLARRFVIALLAFVAALHLGTHATKLSPSKIKRSDGRAFRVSLSEKDADQLAASNWLVISSKNVLSPQRWLLADPWMQRSPSVALIENYGGGGWRLKGRNVYFSSPDGSDPTRDGITYRIVRERTWLPVVRCVICLLCLLGSFGMLMRRIGPGLRSAFGMMCSDRSLLVCLLGFAAFFAAHQWRFLSQDDRLQRITSRFDDGYMLERLFKAAELKTMDPLRLDNKAYGAIGFYPFAILPYAASHLGVTPSLEVLNGSVRGLKIIFSLGALAAAWLLGARHFGKGASTATFLLLATNFGFLSYSSFPFYPDVLMAGLSTMSLAFLLDLVSRWSPRSFFATIAFAALSVSVKFLTFLLFPFIFVVSAVALWREHRDHQTVFRRELFRHWTVAGVLCVAVFFLCNPYLRYNVEWIVPNYKLCGSYYSAETPNFVAGARASFSTWLNAGYKAGSDKVEIAALIVAGIVSGIVLVRLAVSCTRRKDPRFRWPGGVVSAVLVVVLFGVIFQLYLLRSMTLAESIDQRLLLPLYPLIYLIAAWGVLSGIERLPSKGRSAAAIACGVAVTGLAIPRLQNAGDFFRLFGRPPASTPVGDWLAAAKVPGEAWIVNGLQSYVPATYKDVSAGMWLPKDVNHVMRRMGALPAVYVEDETGFDENFSSAVRDRGINSAVQQRLHEQGAEIYGALHRNEFRPYELAAWGDEPVGLNSIVHASRKFRLYANPLAFSIDLADQAALKLANGKGQSPIASLPASAKGSLTLTWPQPVTAGAIHVITIKKPCPSLHARLERTDGTQLTVPIAAIGSPEPDVTQRIATLDPAPDISSITLIRADGTPYDADLIAAVHVYPPVPVGLNTTQFFFEAGGTKGTLEANDSLIAWRPSPSFGWKFNSGIPRHVALFAKVACQAEEVTVVLNDTPAGDCDVSCEFFFAGGSKTEAHGVEHRVLSPPRAYFRFQCPSDKILQRIVFTAESKGNGNSIRQIHVKARLPADTGRGS